MTLYRLLLLASLTAGWTQPTVACTSAELNAFVAAAQSLDKTAVPSGRALIRCPQVKDQAIQWLAFLLDKTGDHAASLLIDDQLQIKSGLGGVLAKARSGSYQELLAKIEDQDPAFTTNAQSQLILARVLTRKGQFARGREAYAFYLKLHPEDDDAETERLYALIWAGDFPQAEEQLHDAERWSASPGFKAALGRGQALVARLSGKSAGQTPPPVAGGALLPGELQGSYGLYRIGSLYDRRTTAVDYHSLVDFHLAAHTISDLGLTNSKTSADEFSLGGALGTAESWHVAAHGGYFSLGDDHYTGDISAGLPLGAGFFAEGGSSATPLVLSVPLSPDNNGLMRDAIYGDLRYLHLVELHLELQKEKSFKPHEAHRLLGRLPLRQKAGDVVAVIVPLNYASHPQPIPEYDSYLRSVDLGAGVAVDQIFASRWRLNAAATYSLAFVTLRDPTQHTKQVGVFHAAADARIPLDEFLQLLISARYVKAQDDDYLRNLQAPTSILVGLGYGDWGTLGESG